MKRRLSVAVSLVGDPAVIFLDEPVIFLKKICFLLYNFFF